MRKGLWVGLPSSKIIVILSSSEDKRRIDSFSFYFYVRIPYFGKAIIVRIMILPVILSAPEANSPCIILSRFEVCIMLFMVSVLLGIHRYFPRSTSRLGVLMFVTGFVT